MTIQVASAFSPISISRLYKFLINGVYFDMSGRRPSAFEADSSEQSGPQMQIVVHAGPLAGKGFPITRDKITFGRDPNNDISWDDHQVSRRHAQLTRRGDQLILEDLDSTNGTMVNGQPIVGAHTLQPADIISIGTSIFGVKGFSAPLTQGMTQVSPKRMVQPSAAPAPAPAASPRPAPLPAQSGSTGSSWYVIGGVLALIVVILILAAITAYVLTQDSGTPVVEIPTVVITSPANGSQHQLNLPVTIQATASDPSGVIRMELWVDGLKTAEATSPAAGGQPTLTASLQWVPTILGSHNLEIRAYNVQERVNEPATVLVNAMGNPPTDTPTPTATPEPPTATVPANPSLTTLADLNVRAGPGTDYEFVGLLLSGKEAEIVGRDESGQWWQIRFDPAPDGVGWVIAGPSFSTVSNADGVPVVPAPGLPTDTPTATPTATDTSIPPTETPTTTPIPATETPTATITPTATEEGPKAEFTISPTLIEGGECVNVAWNVIEVREVYFQGEGVPGVGGRQECPNETTIYRLRIVNLDGSERVEDRTVEVINPVVSAGTITIDPGQTINFDEGVIPGDDFAWNVSGSTRHFEVLAGVELAPQGQLTSLSGLTLENCTNAAFGQYTFIDGSDVVADPVNALTAGRTACYRTNQGRLGKLRFQQYSTQSLTIEWLTWQ